MRDSAPKTFGVAGACWACQQMVQMNVGSVVSLLEVWTGDMSRGCRV